MRNEQEGEKMTLSEAVKTIKDYCSKAECKNCFFGILYKNELFEEGGIWSGCKLNEAPCDWKVPPETNIYDKEEIHENCTVQILKNSVTGETSVGWWENKEAEE